MFPPQKNAGEAAGADGEAAAGSAGDLADIIPEGGYTGQQILRVDEQLSTGRRCRLGLS